MLKILSGQGLINSKCRFLNIEYKRESRIFGSNLFRSIIVEGKYLF